MFFFSTFSVVLIIFLVVSCSLIGVGFYGIRQAGTGTISIVGFYFSIVGSVSTALDFSGISEPQYKQLVIELVVVKLGLILILISGHVGSFIKCNVE